MTFNSKSKIYPDGTAVSHEYAPDGKPLRTTRASGRWAENIYDTQNRLIETAAGMTPGQPPDSASFFTYAPLSRLATASNAAASYAYAHSALGVVTNETVEIGALAFTLERGIDERSRISSLNIAPNGAAEFYAYDNENRLNVISNAAFTLTYAYGQNRVIGYDIEIAGGSPSNSVLTRNISRMRAYPERITEITHTFDGAPISRRISDHDLIGRKTAERALGANTHTNNYAYNKRSELSEAKYENLLGSPTTLTDKFNYDGIGNLHTALGLQTTTYAANALNQYVQIKEGNSPPTALTYDPDGNLLSDGTFEYAWDSATRLAAVYSSNTLIHSNAYDHAGRRVTKQTPDTTHTYIYDGWNPILEIIAHTGGATTTNQYFWGIDLSGTPEAGPSGQGAGGVGGLVAVSLNGTLYFPLTDSNGNITEYIDANGAIAAQYRYDAYGATQEESGPMSAAFSFRFSTKYQDPETTLYYYGYRFYSPALRRWINRDPIEEAGGLNLYAFCGNDGVNRWDYLGLDFIAIGARAVGGKNWLWNSNPIFRHLSIIYFAGNSCVSEGHKFTPADFGKGVLSNINKEHDRWELINETEMYIRDVLCVAPSMAGPIVFWGTEYVNVSVIYRNHKKGPTEYYVIMTDANLHDWEHVVINAKTYPYAEQYPTPYNPANWPNSGYSATDNNSNTFVFEMANIIGKRSETIGAYDNTPGNNTMRPVNTQGGKLPYKKLR